MSDWTPQDYAIFLPLFATTLGGIYLTVVRPLLTQITELVAAIRANTVATDTSAKAQTSNAVATALNTEATKQVAEALPASPVTVINNPPPV